MVTASWGQGSWWWSMATGTGDEKKSGADSYADQIFGDSMFEGNTWTNKKPTRIPLES